MYIYLNYWILAWGSTFKTSLKPIIILQKKALRILTKIPYLYHTSELFKSLKLLNLTDIYKYKLADFLFKFINSNEKKLYSKLHYEK